MITENVKIKVFEIRDLTSELETRGFKPGWWFRFSYDKGECATHFGPSPTREECVETAQQIIRDAAIDAIKVLTPDGYSVREVRTSVNDPAQKDEDSAFYDAPPLTRADVENGVALCNDGSDY